MAWMISRFKGHHCTIHGIMTSCVRIGIAASMMGVCTRTIRRWDAAGKITCTRTPGGHRRVSLAIIEGQQPRERRFDESLDHGRAAVYCRVSSHEQKAKGDLDRQVATATHLNGSRNVRIAPTSPRLHAKEEGARYRPLACRASTSLSLDEPGLDVQVRLGLK